MLKYKNLNIVSSNRSYNIRANIITSSVIKGASIIVSFSLISLTVRYVDAADYGIWLTLSSIVSWLTFFDIGFGNGLRNKFTEAIAQNDKVLAQKYVSTTYGILSCIVLVLWISLIIINYFIKWDIVLNTSVDKRDELSALSINVISFFCIQFVLRLLNTVLQANQQTSVTSIIDFVSNFLILINVYFFLHINSSGSLIKLSIMYGLWPIIVLTLSTLYIYVYIVPEYKPKISLIDIRYLKPLLGLGIKFFVVQITAIVIFQTTNLIITQILGSAQVSLYNITYKYYSILIMITSILSIPLWSAITDAYTKSDYKWIKSVLTRLDYLYYILIIAAFFLYIFMKDILKIWIGDFIVVPDAISIAMFINIILAIRWNLYVSLINGTGKIFLQLVINIVVTILFVPIAIVLAKSTGLLGVVFANILTNFVYAIMIPLQTKRLFNQTAKGIWDR